MKYFRCLVSLITCISLLLSVTVFSFSASAEQPTLESYLVSQIDSMGQSEKTKIDCSHYINDYENYNTFVVSLSNAINNVFNQHPEFFFTKLANIETKTGIANFTYIDYSSRQRLFDDYSLIKNFGTQITSTVSQSFSNYEKALYLHDILISNLKKGTNYQNNINFEKADSEIYSLLYEYLLKLSSIESDTIIDYATSHYWNAVKLGEYWYFIDTYNDDNDIEGRLSHSHFILNKSEINPVYSSWSFKNISLTEDSTYSNDVIKNARTKVFISDDYKYVNNLGQFVSYDKSTGSTTTLVDITDRWTSFSDNGYYSGNYSALDYLNGYYLISTPKKVLAYKDGQTNILYTINSTKSEIYGLNVDDSINVVLKTTDSSSSSTIETLDFTLNVEVIDEYVKVNQQITSDNIKIDYYCFGEELNIKIEDVDFNDCQLQATTDVVKKATGSISYNGKTAEFNYTTYMLGDINRDNSIGAIDVLLLRMAILNQKELTNDEFKSASLTNSNSIGALDLLLLKKLTLNISDN